MYNGKQSSGGGIPAAPRRSCSSWAVLRSSTRVSRPPTVPRPTPKHRRRPRRRPRTNAAFRRRGDVQARRGGVIARQRGSLGILRCLDRRRSIVADHGDGLGRRRHSGGAASSKLRPGGVIARRRGSLGLLGCLDRRRSIVADHGDGRGRPRHSGGAATFVLVLGGSSLFGVGI